MFELYLDNSATTEVSNEVLESMLPYLKGKYGNPSSIHTKGKESLNAISEARKSIADYFKCKPSNIIFTSGGSESNNLAIKGVARHLRKTKNKNHIITSMVEHHSVLNTCKELEKEGFKVTYLKVNKKGQIDLKSLFDSITDDTALVSIMWVNNETGHKQDLKEIYKICKSKNVLFHTDAVQSTHCTDFKDITNYCDMFSLSGHKFHAPKGIGLLYMKYSIKLSPIINGGQQERGLRAGTENVASIVGLATAVNNIKPISNHMKYVKCRISDMLSEIQNANQISFNFDDSPVINISFEGIEGESLVLLLDSKCIYISSGSACTSGSLEPSHVIKALGYSDEIARGSIRISIADNIFYTEEDICRIGNTIGRAVEILGGLTRNN